MRRECLYCGKAFRPGIDRRRQAMMCSEECTYKRNNMRQNARRVRHRPAPGTWGVRAAKRGYPARRKCRICGAWFLIEYPRWNALTCSDECRRKSKRLYDLAYHKKFMGTSHGRKWTRAYHQAYYMEHKAGIKSQASRWMAAHRERTRLYDQIRGRLKSMDRAPPEEVPRLMAETLERMALWDRGHGL